jgi:hypothetical protein
MLDAVCVSFEDLEYESGTYGAQGFSLEGS